MLITVMRNSVRLWKTTLEANYKAITQVTIKCGIYQCGPLYPLLFLIGLKSISQLITKCRHKYGFRSGVAIGRLLCMDDIKLDASKLTH